MTAEAPNETPKQSSSNEGITESSPLIGDAQASKEWCTWASLKAIGPGLLVCLADTDAGCLVVAAQSGARWGYSLLLLQLLLIPVLYLAQELTIRLGIYTKQGHTACIRQHFGPVWAWFATLILVLECIAAMVSEMSGIAAVGEIWGLSRIIATVLAALVITVVVIFLDYRKIELIGIACGLFELTFVISMFCVKHDPSEVLKSTFTFHSDAEYVKLVSANIGAVIMPWMIYFQQSAVVARQHNTGIDLGIEQAETLCGSFLTQLVMIGALVTLAGARDRRRDLETVGDIVDALAPAMGGEMAKVLVSLAFLGGSLCASLVVSLAAAWAVCEARGFDGSALSLDQPPMEAPFFYSCFLIVVAIGAGILLTGVNLVSLNVIVELLDGILMPFAVGFLFLLATGPALPIEVRIVGWRKGLLAVIFTLCTMLSLVSAAYGIFA